MPTTSTFALLEIKKGRGAVRKQVEAHKKKIPVTITGFITDTWSGDDGTGIEFEVTVTGHKLGKPIKHECQCVRCANADAGSPSKRA